MKLSSCSLGELAECHLGFKSLQNQFFYIDSEVADRYGIEDRFLKPILRLGDTEPASYLQPTDASTSLFYCTLSERDLRGTGALRYIRDMAGRPASLKRQASKLRTIQEALEAQGGGTWYAPKAMLHEAHLWLRKAFATRFAPFIYETPVVHDQRCNYLVPKGELEWEQLAAVLTSSLFSLSLESSGASSLGAGALEVPTTKLRTIRVPDVRGLPKSSQAEVADLVKKIWENEAPIDWQNGKKPGKHLEMLDRWFLERMDPTISSERIYQDLAETAASRIRKAKTKGGATRKAETHDIEAVAEGIEAHVRPILDGRRFPESFFERAAKTETLDFSGQGTLQVQCEQFLGRAAVAVSDAESGTVLFETSVEEPVAQIMVRALLLGRHTFRVPTDPAVAEDVLRGFFDWLPPIMERVRMECAETTIGTKYEQRVYDTVLRRLGVRPEAATLEIFGVFTVL